MLNQIRNVLDWNQRTKLFDAIRNAHSKKSKVDLAHLPIELVKGYKIGSEQEKAKVEAFLVRGTLII